MSGLRLRQGAALLRDWAVPGSAIAQWTHFVTSTCNARCKHCFYPINQHKNELTLDEITRLTKTMPPIRLLLISGGEPFLRRDLPDVMRVYFENCGFLSASIPTNGFNAKVIAQSVEKICSISPDLHLGVAVSIDGFAEFHDTMRAVPGIYGKALETLEAMVELSRRFPNLTASVNTVFMRDNQRRGRGVLRFHPRALPAHLSRPGADPRRRLRPEAQGRASTSTSTSGSRQRSTDGTRRPMRLVPGGGGCGRAPAARSTGAGTSTSHARRRAGPFETLLHRR